MRSLLLNQHHRFGWNHNRIPWLQLNILQRFVAHNDVVITCFYLDVFPALLAKPEFYHFIARCCSSESSGQGDRLKQCGFALQGVLAWFRNLSENIDGVAVYFFDNNRDLRILLEFFQLLRDGFCKLWRRSTRCTYISKRGKELRPSGLTATTFERSVFLHTVISRTSSGPMV